MESSPILLVSALSLLLSDALALCEQSNVSIGFLFNCQIGWEDFYGVEQPAPSGVQVQYSVSLDSAAGKPSWLTLLQSDNQGAASPVFLYGTPREDDLGKITLNAFLTRLDTLEKSARDITIDIQKPLGNILQLSEFYITNYTVEDFLNTNVIMRFEETLSRVYQHEGAAVTKIINPLERGILVPPPPTKHGAIVQSTPGLDVASVTMVTSNEASLVQGNCDPSNRHFSLPPSNFELFAGDGFDISWCQYVTYTLSGNNQQEPGNGGLVATVETTPVQDLVQPNPSGSYISLVVVMALGFVLLIMVVSGLALVFFGRRKTRLTGQQRYRRNTMKHHIQEDTRGSASAQKHLRDLALSIPSGTSSRIGEGQPQPALEVSGEEGGLLEFQDVTDYGNRHESDRDEQTPPPPPEYTYDEELLSQPLYEPGKRYRLITV